MKKQYLMTWEYIITIADQNDFLVYTHGFLRFKQRNLRRPTSSNFLPSIMNLSEMRTFACILGFVLSVWLADTAYAGWACDSLSIAPNLTRTVQRTLTENGFEAGPIDGQWGGMTENALKQFQRRNNLPDTGLLDQHTVDALFGKEAGIIVHRVRLPAVGDDPQGWERHQKEMEEARRSADIVIIENVEGFGDKEYEEMCERFKRSE